MLHGGMGIGRGGEGGEGREGRVSVCLIAFLFFVNRANIDLFIFKCPLFDKLCNPLFFP